MSVPSAPGVQQGTVRFEQKPPALSKRTTTYRKEGSKKKSAAQPVDSAPAGALIKSLIKGKRSNPNELKLEDLDENVLRQRLDLLEKELEEYKVKCARYKKENEWYREELKGCETDSVDYIRYLESKKEEKQAVIDKLVECNKKELEQFVERKKRREIENAEMIESLKALLVEQEMKLEAKQEEMLRLSDVMSKRARYEAEIAKIKKEMQDAEADHHRKLAEVERQLLEARMKHQKEADNKIKMMESAAHEKAAKYLEDHTLAIENENRTLEKELQRYIQITKESLLKKEALEKKNKELLREQILREDMVRLRISRIKAKEKKERLLRQERKKEAMEKRKLAVEGALARGKFQAVAKTLGFVKEDSSAHESVRSAASGPVVGSLPSSTSAKVVIPQVNSHPTVVQSSLALNALGPAGDRPTSTAAGPKESTPNQATRLLQRLSLGDLEWSDDEEDDEYL
ncbi:uncharacterized protein BJ171DRAFT_600414 [Polychytrium aggregatum]|uniref:uncharacterized protein n=1 Tax=Polychytrium aggregatum TaxID=110093 RepID=UPI0022FE8140|nr:uncharacterized protein BJ171DRAFT_600414 [Polychytrium aggregatum]KAI9202965.1 hypothetical protein BJ171DRAFT_600414 [Polychytrium aggregatum]